MAGDGDPPGLPAMNTGRRRVLPPLPWPLLIGLAAAAAIYTLALVATRPAPRRPLPGTRDGAGFQPTVSSEIGRAHV